MSSLDSTHRPRASTFSHSPRQSNSSHYDPNSSNFFKDSYTFSPTNRFSATISSVENSPNTSSKSLPVTLPDGASSLSSLMRPAAPSFSYSDNNKNIEVQLRQVLLDITTLEGVIGKYHGKLVREQRIQSAASNVASTLKSKKNKLQQKKANAQVGISLNRIEVLTNELSLFLSKYEELCTLRDSLKSSSEFQKLTPSSSSSISSSSLEMFPETEPLAFQEQPSAMTSLFHSDPVADSASILYSFPSNFHSANDSKHRASHFNFINKLPTLPSPETKFYHHTNSLGYESLLTPEKTPSSQNIYISDSDDSDNSDNSQLSVSTDEKENGFEEEMNVEASRGNFKEFHLNGDDFNTPFSSKESQKEREMVSLLPFESFMQFSQTSSNSTRRPRTSKLFLPSVNSNEKILSPIPSATLPSSMDNEALKQHIKSLITRQSVLYPKSPQDSIYSKPQVFSESPSFQPNSLNQEKIPKSPKSYMTARSLSPTVPSLASPSLENGSVSEIFSHYAAFFANMEVHPPETLRSTELASMLLQLENQLAYTLSQFKSNSSLQAVMIAFFMLIQSERKKMQASKKP